MYSSNYSIQYVPRAAAWVEYYAWTDSKTNASKVYWLEVSINAETQKCDLYAICPNNETSKYRGGTDKIA